MGSPEVRLGGAVCPCPVLDTGVVLRIGNAASRALMRIRNRGHKKTARSPGPPRKGVWFYLDAVCRREQDGCPVERAPCVVVDGVLTAVSAELPVAP